MIGDMDRKITIQTKTTARDEWGQAIDTFTDLATVWAEYKPRINSAASLQSMEDQVQFKEVASFVIRYRDDVPDTARILFGGKTWMITQRGEVGISRRRFMEFVCVAHNSDRLDGN